MLVHEGLGLDISKLQSQAAVAAPYIAPARTVISQYAPSSVTSVVDPVLKQAQAYLTPQGKVVTAVTPPQTAPVRVPPPPGGGIKLSHILIGVGALGVLGIGAYLIFK